MTLLTPSPVAERLSRAIGERVWHDEQVLDPREIERYRALYGEHVVRDGVPAGFGAALVMRAALLVLHDDALSLPFEFNLHAAQRLTWDAPLRAGARVRTRAEVANVRPRERATFFDVLTTTVDDADRTLLRGVATQAVRHA